MLSNWAHLVQGGKTHISSLDRGTVHLNDCFSEFFGALACVRLWLCSDSQTSMYNAFITDLLMTKLFIWEREGAGMHVGSPSSSSSSSSSLTCYLFTLDKPEGDTRAKTRSTLGNYKLLPLRIQTYQGIPPRLTRTAFRESIHFHSAYWCELIWPWEIDSITVTFTVLCAHGCLVLNYAADTVIWP